MTEHQREAECVSYCLTIKMDKDQGKKSTVKHCKFRPFSKPVWPNRSDSKEWLFHKWLIGFAGSAERDMGNYYLRKLIQTLDT